MYEEDGPETDEADAVDTDGKDGRITEDSIRIKHNFAFCFDNRRNF